MTTITDETYLVYSDPVENNNKFYRVTLDASGTLTKAWGRVGATGQRKVEGGRHRAHFDAAVRAKESKGYRRVNVAGQASSAPLANRAVLAEAARREAAASQDASVLALLDRLAACNRHAIATMSGGKITVATDGAVRTSAGVAIAAHAVRQARLTLDQIAASTPADPRWPSLVRDYLTAIPQKVGSRKGWDVDLLVGADKVRRQHDLLDALEAATSQQPTQDDQLTVGFRYKVARVTDPSVIDEVTRLYEGSRKDGHQSARHRVKAVYELVDSDEHTRKFQAHRDRSFGTRRLWHGSQAHNLLSILKSGLVVPGVGNSIPVATGAMFGPGVYFSETSTKSLNYATGFWGGDSANGVYALLADVVMGWEYRPRTWSDWRQSRTTKNPKGGAWDSINVKPGTAGVQNHEAIVWSMDQFALRYLVEFA